MPNTTSRLGLVQPLVTDPPTVLRTGMTTDATALDNAAIFKSGTLAARPGAGTVVAGTYYLATDLADGGSQGTLFQSNGVTWVYPNGAALGSGAIASRPGAGTLGRQYFATDTNQTWIDSGSTWVPTGGLRHRSTTVNTSANYGEIIEAAAGNLTVTLPSPSVSGQIVGVVGGGGGTTPVTVSGTNIYGTGMWSGSSSFKLGTVGSFAILQSDGSNWIIVAGEQDTGWVNVTPAANFSLGSGAYRTAAVRLQGDRVDMRGALSLSADTGGAVTMATVPSFAVIIGAVFQMTQVFGVSYTVLPAILDAFGRINCDRALGTGTAYHFDGNSWSL